MKKLRIAIWHNLPSGGGKRQLYNHVKGLLERGHYLESWCPDTADQKFLPLGGIIKEHIVPLEKKRGLYNNAVRPLKIIRELLNVMENHCRACGEEINRGGFDVLFTNACMYLRTSAIAKYVDLPSSIYLGEPYRWFYEAMPELPWIAPPDFSDRRAIFRTFRDFIEKKITMNGMRVQARAELEYAKLFDLILVNSIYSRETVLRTYNLESKVCYLGIDTDHYKPTGEPREDFVVGLGTIYHAKGIDRALRALGTIEKTKRPALVWIGNGASEVDLRRYKALAEELEVSFTPKIHLPDEEVISYLSRALAMIYTSRLEPFGLAPLEANACCTPVVGIAEGGVKETIRDGINGFLVPDDDSQFLGERIRMFVDEPELSQVMGPRGREHVKDIWNMKQCTDNIENFLSRLSNEKKEKKKKKIHLDVAALPEIYANVKIALGIDTIKLKRDSLQISGWAMIDDGQDASGSEIFVLVKNGAEAYLLGTTRIKRPDVTEHFGSKCNLDDTGFSVDSFIAYDKKSTKIGIMIRRSGKTALRYIKQ